MFGCVPVIERNTSSLEEVGKGAVILCFPDEEDPGAWLDPRVSD